MVKKLLLPALGASDLELFVEKTRSGNRYYARSLDSNRYERVSKEGMQDIIRSMVRQYGFINYHMPREAEEDREALLNVRRLTPELLPKLVALSDNETSWKVVPEKDFCPPGYDFIPAEKPKRLKNGDTLRGYCKLR